jgi:ATP-dependent DNA ligase
MVYDLFGAACHLGLEGIVSKRCDRAYSAGKMYAPD